MLKLQQLTDAERLDAEKYHNYVYTFLHLHGYSVSDFYDIAAIGYLKGIQKWHRKPELQEYSIITICKWAIRSELANYTRLKANRKTVSLDVDYSAERDRKTNLYNYIGVNPFEELEDTQNRLEQKAEAKQKVQQILSLKLSKKQTEIVSLLLKGYTPTQIEREFNLSRQAFYDVKKKIKQKYFDKWGATVAPAI